MHRRTGLGVVALLVVGACVWWLGRRQEEPAPDAPALEHRSTPTSLAPRPRETPGTTPGAVVAPRLVARLAGAVVADPLRTPVLAATLTFVSPTRGPVETTSGADGGFSVELEPGEWALTRAIAEDLVGPAYGQLTFDLAPSTALDTLVVRMVRLRWFEGDVVDAEGELLAGAQVNDTLTDAHGAFRVWAREDLADLSATHPCCATSFMVGRKLDTDRLRLTLERHLPRRGDVKGTVVDGRGAPVAHATLSCSPRLADGGFDFRALDRAFEVDTDELGRFSFAVGDEVVALSASTDTGRTSTVLAHPGDQVTLRLEPTDRVVRGRVVDARGEPFEAFTVSFHDQEESFITTSGRFTLRGLARRKGLVTVETPSAMEPSSTQVDLTDRDVDIGDVTLVRGRSLELTVRSRDTHAPIVDAQVQHPGGQAATDAAGRLVLQQLPEPPWLITVWASGFHSVEERVSTPRLTLDLEPVRDDAGSTMTYEGVGMRYEPDGGVVTELRGPALEAGVRVGDELVAVDDQPLTSFRDNAAAISAIKGAAGTVVKLTYRREGHLFDVRVVRRRLTW